MATKKKILVTGYKGFIGSNLGQYFHQAGHDVEGFEYVPGVIPDITRYDWVIHCGAISSTTETDIDKVWLQNFEFTSRLLQVADHYGVNVQIASSASVYGNNFNPNPAFKETDKCLPVSPYSWSKYLVDKFLLDNTFEEFNCLIQSFRYFNVYGPGEGHKKDQMSPISKFQIQAQDGVIKLFENSDQYKRDFVCVYDLCKIHELMMDEDVSGIFNVGTGNPRSFQEIGEIIAKKYNAKIEYIPMPDNLKPHYQTYTCADNTKLHNTIPFRKWLTVEEYINDTRTS